MRNCWACVGSWILRGATRGRVNLTPQAVRRELRAWDCRTGGLGDIAHLLERHRKDYRLHADLTREQARRILDRPGHLFAMPTDYDVLTGRADTGVYHMIGMVGGIDGTSLRVMDPMDERMSRPDVGLILSAGIAYGRDHSDGRTLDLIEVIRK
jgi:hypothetical protein